MLATLTPPPDLAAVLAYPGAARSHPFGAVEHSAPDLLTPDDVEFVAISFEGPDRYACAGGLGVRITELTRALAERGFVTHLYFIGDPDLPSQEQVGALPLHYHRWGQWLSREYHAGVYAGEDAKRSDLETSLPEYLIGERVAPAAALGKRVVILCEEWHTAEVACRISDALWAAGLRDRTVMLWNANNTLGFEHVNFERLRFTQAVSTVSRYMKHEMWRWGVNPLVIPNGIPARLLERSAQVADLTAFAQSHLRGRLTLAKVARFDPDKRWLMAVEAAAGLKQRGLPVLFFARGGMEEHGHAVLRRAHESGLRVADAWCDSAEPLTQMKTLLDAAAHADFVHVRFPLPELILRTLYRVADAMLQNSGREPFGLVGLEVMAAGGLLFTGATGEEYARPNDNAVVLDTEDPREIETALLGLLDRPHEIGRLRRRGQETAPLYTWSRVVDVLLSRVRYLAGDGPDTQPGPGAAW